MTERQPDFFGGRQNIIGGYRGHPGAGPNNETCGSCGNCRVWRPNRRNYYKCALVEATRGPGTDIRLSTPACEYWTPDE